MSTSRSKLTVEEVDEISLVDRPANQHGLVALSKAMEGVAVDDNTDLSEDDFDVVDVDDLKHGDIVVDEDGELLVLVDEGAEDFDEIVAELEDSEGVEKGMMAPLQAFKAGYKGLASPVKNARWNNPAALGQKAAAGTKKIKDAPAWAKYTAAGTAGAATGAGAVMASKSLAEEIGQLISKATTEQDTQDIIVKMATELEITKAESAAAIEYAEAVESERIASAFISKAAEYNLPIDSETLGVILMKSATVLEEDELEALDQLFTAIGDHLFDELGYVGDGDSSTVLDQVEAMADEYVGKSDFSKAQITTAMFDANPSAYDAYLNEKGR
jgi:hypothetical protein